MILRYVKYLSIYVLICTSFFYFITCTAILVHKIMYRMNVLRTTSTRTYIGYTVFRQ